MLPLVVIVHGAWHTLQHYQELIDTIKEQGIPDVVCLRLPSATTTLPLPPTADYAHDTELLQCTLGGVAEAERPIVMLMHSYVSRESEMLGSHILMVVF